MLLLHVLPLALGAAVSPALLGASLGILGAFGSRALRMLGLYLVGTAAVVMAALALTALPVVHLRRGGGAVSDVVDLALAAVLIALAILTAVRRPRPASGREQALLKSRWAGPGVIGLGVLMMATNVSTLVLVIAGGRDVAADHSPLLWRALAAGLLCCGALLPVLLPLLWRIASPVRAQHGLAAIERTFRRHSRAITIVVCGATAVYLVLRGLGIL